MKRFRSSDDLDSHGEKGVSKDWGRRDEDLGLHRSLSYRSSYYKSENGRKGLSFSSSRYDRLEDDRESLRSVRKRSDYDVDSYDRRKSYDRYKDGSDKGILRSSPRAGYGADRINRSESFSGTDRINRSESFSGPRRDFPKRFRSERDRSRREGSVSSWQRFGGGKDDEGTKNGGDLVKGSWVTPDDVEKVRSSLGLRDGKSSPWSKDFGNEQSKSVEVKKSEDLLVDSGNSSEMEEGELEPELEPEPVPVPEPVTEDQALARMDSNQELDSEKHIGNKVAEDGVKSFLEEKEDLNEESVQEVKAENRPSETVQDAVEEVAQLRGCQHDPIPETCGGGHVTETTTYDEGVKDEKCANQNSNCEEEASDGFAEKLVPLEEKQKEDKGIDLEVKVENIDLPEFNKGVVEKNGASRVASSLVTEEITQNFKNKGKSVAVSPSYGTDVEDGFRIERESRSLLTGRDNDMEGPSTRGFELFLTDPVKKPEKVDQSSHNKPKEEKLGFEPLELSLSLPNVLLPIGSKNATEIPGSPSHTRSVQSFPSSFQTNSDRFTASMSFSGSQQFTHNPSCSLTHNSLDNYDYEQSVGSRPIFQGVDWQNLSSKEHKNKEVPMYQRTLSNANGFHQSQASQSISNGQAMQLQHLPGAEGSSRISVGLDRQLSFSKHLSGAQWRHPDDVRAPSQSVGSHQAGSEHIKEKNRVTREHNIGAFHQSSNQEEKVKMQMGGPEFAEPIITMIVSEPLHMTAKRFNEMATESVSFLKEYVHDIVLNPGKRWQFCALQKALQNRSDISLDMLLKSHRAQLEILVSLKTGLQEFLRRNYDISSSDLAEIFMNLRCRNLACRNLLPVEECDCKVCAQKNGFCSACMCLVCLKFDNASNTCSWVGCDLCLHWCHTDCGLRESYVRNGLSETGLQRTAEMQFHCVACNHPSEMFGFVKEVFQNFAKDWTTETLSKELEYVRRIFCASEDVTGKRLHEIIIQLLSRLANKAELHEVKNHIMCFLTESDSFKSDNTAIVSGKELSTKNQGEGSNGIVESSQAAVWLKSFYSGKATQLENPAGLLPRFDFDRNGKHAGNSDLQTSVQKEPVLDELDSIVRIKQAEARMFQARADDARREAEGLKRIAIAKNEKIEEEYANRFKKLHLTEAEEMRKQKLEELEALEKAHQEYFRMKMRMEAEIKDLLLKMEATRRNLTM